MAKSKLITPTADFGVLLGADGAEMHQRVPAVSGVTPTGSQVLVEIFTSQEMMNTNLFVGEVEVKTPLQGYIRGVGPSFKTADWGFKAGDRVIISGSGIMAPKYDQCHRDRFLMDPHSIKAVLTEENG
jgi:co-chaperonin GroES (HSP10)